MPHFVMGEPSTFHPKTLTIRCPQCMQNGSFEPLPKAQDVGWHNTGPGGVSTQFKAGLKRCPNLSCRALLFFVEELNGPMVTYPPEVIDFDASNLPDNIVSTLEEAIKCHAAGCYRACALLLRRTLEELCEDKGATGSNLKKRIESLKTVAVIPAELLSAADELRILGNDAAHIELKDYDKVGKDEADIAIELTKELLKAIYQYSSLLAKLQALKGT